MSLAAAAVSARRWRILLLVVAWVLALGACGRHAAPSGGPLAPTFSDVAYASTSAQQRLDLFLPRHAGRPAPLVIWIHGGGWRAGDKSALTDSLYGSSASPRARIDCHDIVQVQVPDVVRLTAKGYAVAGLNYRTDHDPVAAVSDAKAAVRFLRANAARYHLDPHRFAAWGNSAGGYSAIMLGLTGGQNTVFDDPSLGNPGVSSAVQAVVDWFGAADLSDIPGNLGAAESPFTYIAPGRSLPPFMIAHGDADCIVPLQHSRNLHDALTRAGASATLTVLPGAGHEDPAFMRTQSTPTIAFLDHTFAH